MYGCMEEEHKKEEKREMRSERRRRKSEGIIGEQQANKEGKGGRTKARGERVRQLSIYRRTGQSGRAAVSPENVHVLCTREYCGLELDYVFIKQIAHCYIAASISRLLFHPCVHGERFIEDRHPPPPAKKEIKTIRKQSRDGLGWPAGGAVVDRMIETTSSSRHTNQTKSAAAQEPQPQPQPVTVTHILLWTGANQPFHSIPFRFATLPPSSLPYLVGRGRWPERGPHHREPQIEHLHVPLPAKPDIRRFQIPGVQCL